MLHGPVCNTFLAVLLLAWPANAQTRAAARQQPGAAPVEWVAEIRTARDVTGKPSWFRRLLRAVAGLDDRIPVMLQPHGVGVDRSGRILVADTKLRVVHQFDPARNAYRMLTAPEKDPLVAPIGVSTDAEDRVYVTDAVRARVFVFSREGKFLRTLGALSREESIFHRPTGVAVDAARGRLYVVDTAAMRIVVLSLEGKVLARWGQRGTGPGEFNYPTHIAVGPDGSLWVADSLNFRVQHLDAAGHFLGEFGRLGSGPAEFDKIKGIAATANGLLFVVEARHDRVMGFSAGGQLRFVFGGTGAGPGQFILPAGVAAGPGGEIYVADSFNRRIQVFRLREHPAAGAE